MNNQQLLDYFECASDSDDADLNDDDLLTAVKDSGEDGRKLVAENLKQDRYLLRSLWLAKTLVMKEAIAEVDRHLDSKDIAVKVAAAITSSALGSDKGKNALNEMIKMKVISTEWVG